MVKLRGGCNMKNKNQKTFVKFCRKCVSFVRCGFNFIHLTGKLKLNFSINRNESRVEITMFNTYCAHNVPYIMIVSGCAVCCVLCAQQCSGKSVVKFLIETVLNVFVCACVYGCVFNASSYKNVIVICYTFMLSCIF